jgi:hypothetical protein
VLLVNAGTGAGKIAGLKPASHELVKAGELTLGDAM